MLRNYQLLREGGGEEQEPQCSFQATVLWLGRPQLCSHPRETESLPELEEASHGGGEGVTRQEVRQQWASVGGLIQLGAGYGVIHGSRFLINGRVIFVR